LVYSNLGFDYTAGFRRERMFSGRGESPHRR